MFAHIRVLKIKPIFFAFMALTITMACLCNGISNVPVTPVITLLLEPTATVTAAPTLQQEAPTLTPKVQGLNPDAPWLLVATKTDLWAANPDGSNLIQLTNGGNWQTDLSMAIRPAGNQVVLLTFGADPYHHLALNLLSLPDGSIKKITDLTTPQTEPSADSAPGDTSLEAMRAISERTSYAWSPDGRKLAFIGALDGPHASVYIYDTSGGTIKRISQDDFQDYSPSWSPDGTHLLYFSADSFGTGAGLAMEGVWSASGDGSDVSLLYKPTSAGEEILGWRDNETAVLESWDPANGPSKLRLYNIASKKQTVLLEDSVQSAAVATNPSVDPGAVLFNKTNGLYLLPSGTDQPQKISGDQVESIRWLPDSSIFTVQFSGGGLTTFMADGSHREDAPFTSLNGTTEVVCYGAIWAWTDQFDSKGAWYSGPGLDTTKLIDGPATAPIWDLHNNLLFFIGSDLYRVTFDSHYTDTAPVGHITGEVQTVAWVNSR
jgi:hypothetical protein